MSGIGGVGNTASYEFGSPDDAAAPAAEPEGQVVRGSTPKPIGGQMANAVLDMSASRLEVQLRASEGMTRTEAKEAAKEIQATAEEISDLEQELADLKELEQIYMEMLADPELDLWDSSWIEWDLWDIRMDIYDIESQLGTLTGDLKELMGGAWSALSGLFQIGTAFQTVETTDIDRQQKDRDIEKRFDKKGKERLDRHEVDDEDRLDELKQKGLVQPVPPKSEEAKKIIAAAQTKVEARKDDRSKELLDEVRSDLKEARRKA
jgi:hypothetical protein